MSIKRAKRRRARRLLKAHTAKGINRHNKTTSWLDKQSRKWVERSRGA